MSNFKKVAAFHIHRRKEIRPGNHTKNHADVQSMEKPAANDQRTEGDQRSQRQTCSSLDSTSLTERTHGRRKEEVQCLFHTSSKRVTLTRILYTVLN